MTGEAPYSVLITGAARGLGHEMARQYRDQGWRVLAPSRAELDVTDSASIAAYAKTIEADPIDVLINNAGVRLTGDDANKLGALAPEPWLVTLSVNTIGPAMVTQAVLPHLRRGRLRKVISLSSRLGSLSAGGGANTGGGGASYYAYRVSKTALSQVNRCLSLDLGPEGFACVLISPGWVRTDMGGAGATDTPAEAARDILQAIDQIGPADNGAFIDRHGGAVPW